MHQKTLILGASGQIGTELTLALRERQDPSTVIASDIREGNSEIMAGGPFEVIDALDKDALEYLVRSQGVEVVYLMAAMLSAKAEKFPEKAWNLNINSLLHILELGKSESLKRIFWPSSIAVFGPGTPKEKTPQMTIMDPTTVYGISKLAGERWCAYYHKKYGVDVRSIRYPGLLSWKATPGGGTTDYAIEMYQCAVRNEEYTCFLNPDTKLPMMYIDDAIRATLDLMSVTPELVKLRTGYNLTSFSITPKDLERNIREFKPDFKVKYQPDYRQRIADSWPGSIDDRLARKQWGWRAEFDLQRTTREMLENLN